MVCPYMPDAQAHIPTQQNSCFSRPFKRTYRIIGRLLEFLTLEFRPSFDPHDLSEAGNDLKQRFEQLHSRKGQNKICFCYGKSMSSASARVVDARKVYEVLDSRKIEYALSSLFDRMVTSSKHVDPTVTVHNGRKSMATWGGYICDRLTVRTKFYMSAIKRCVFLRVIGGAFHKHSGSLNLGTIGYFVHGTLTTWFEFRRGLVGRA